MRKKKKKERNYRAKIYMVSLLHRATIISCTGKHCHMNHSVKTCSVTRLACERWPTGGHLVDGVTALAIANETNLSSVH